MIIVTSLAPPRIRSASSRTVTAPSLDLWHTCATPLLGRGVHPKLVHHHLGHASITMTLDRYSQWEGTPPTAWKRLWVSYCCQVLTFPTEDISVFTAFAGKKESRRADSNRLPHLITS